MSLGEVRIGWGKAIGVVKRDGVGTCRVWKDRVE